MPSQVYASRSGLDILCTCLGFPPLTLYYFAEKVYVAFTLGYIWAEICLDMAHDFPAKPSDAASTQDGFSGINWWRPLLRYLPCPWLLNELDRGLFATWRAGLMKHCSCPVYIGRNDFFFFTTVWRRKG
jgi:hypothetical protein